MALEFFNLGPGTHMLGQIGVPIIYLFIYLFFFFFWGGGSQNLDKKMVTGKILFTLLFLPLTTLTYDNACNIHCRLLKHCQHFF